MLPMICRLCPGVSRPSSVPKAVLRLMKEKGKCFLIHRNITTVVGCVLSKSKFPSITRHASASIQGFSTDPPKHWDDIKELPRFDPDKGELVYVGTLAFMVKGVKAFSVSTSILAMGLQPYLLYQSGNHSTGTVLALGVFMGFFIFCTPMLIHFITKKYVTDMYYNSNTGVFTATTYSFFVRRKKWEFTPEDVKVPAIPGMFTTVTVKGKPLFMDRNLFSSKHAYIKMMSYDKPFDWELGDDGNKNEQKEK